MKKQTGFKKFLKENANKYSPVKIEDDYIDVYGKKFMKSELHSAKDDYAANKFMDENPSFGVLHVDKRTGEVWMADLDYLGEAEENANKDDVIRKIFDLKLHFDELSEKFEEIFGDNKKQKNENLREADEITNSIKNTVTDILNNVARTFDYRDFMVATGLDQTRKYVSRDENAPYFDISFKKDHIFNMLSKYIKNKVSEIMRDSKVFADDAVEEFNINAVSQPIVLALLNKVVKDNFKKDGMEMVQESSGNLVENSVDYDRDYNTGYGVGYRYGDMTKINLNPFLKDSIASRSWIDGFRDGVNKHQEETTEEVLMKEFEKLEESFNRVRRKKK